MCQARFTRMTTQDHIGSFHSQSIDLPPDRHRTAGTLLSLMVPILTKAHGLLDDDEIRRTVYLSKPLIVISGFTFSAVGVAERLVVCKLLNWSLKILCWCCRCEVPARKTGQPAQGRLGRGARESRNSHLGQILSCQQ